MIKYAKNDISDGIKSLSIGVGNIIAAIVRKEISEYILDMPMDYFLVIGALKKMFPGIDIRYSDSSMIISVENTIIRISFKENSVIFSLI